MSLRFGIAFALLAAAAPASASLGQEVILEASGSLLVGTAGIGIGRVDDGAPVPDAGLPPPSLAVHPFRLDGCRPIVVEVSYSSLDAPPVPESAILQVEVRSAAGDVLAAQFLTDGGGGVAPTEPLMPGQYEVRVFHLLGSPVAYSLVVLASSAHDC